VKVGLSPTGRALRALELLQAEPGITASQLAEQLDVTDRAARRYVAILREAGIPVESTRGPYGGYRVGRGIRLPPLVFSAVEALGLVMAVLDGSHAAADADDPVGAALGKIIRALPENVGRQAAAMRRHASAVPDRGAVRPGTGTTSALVAAVAAQRRVSIGYCSQSGRRWAEEVDPWAVVVRHGRWYLLCHSHRAGAVRADQDLQVLDLLGRDLRDHLGQLRAIRHVTRGERDLAAQLSQTGGQLLCPVCLRAPAADQQQLPGAVVLGEMPGLEQAQPAGAAGDQHGACRIERLGHSQHHLSGVPGLSEQLERIRAHVNAQPVSLPPTAPAPRTSNQSLRC